MSDSSPDLLVKASLGRMIALSALMSVGGILAIIIPPTAGTAVAIFFACLLIFGGGAHVAFALETHATRASVWELLLGVLYIGVGVCLLFDPVGGLVPLTLGLAVYLFTAGAMEIILAFLLRPMPGAGWIVLNGIVTLALAIMIWKSWPSNTERALGILVGISLLFSGTTRLLLFLTARRAITKLVGEI